MNIIKFVTNQHWFEANRTLFVNWTIIPKLTRGTNVTMTGSTGYDAAKKYLTDYKKRTDENKTKR
jgi:hypothetical protein